METSVILLKEKFKETEKIRSLSQKKENSIFSLDFASYKQLTKNKINHKLSTDYLDETDKNLINNLSIEITTNWYKNEKLKEFFTINGFNLGWLLEHESYYIFMEAITDFFCLLRIKEKLNPSCVFASTQILELSKTIFSNTQIKLIEGEEENIPRYASEKFQLKYNIGSTPLVLNISRDRFFKLRKYYEKLFVPTFNKLYSKKAKHHKSIILVDFNPVNYTEFLHKLGQTERNVVLVNRRRASIWNIKSFKTVKQSNCIPITYEGFINEDTRNKIKTLTTENVKKLDEVFSEKQLFEKIFSYNGIPYWNHIKNHFIDFCKEGLIETVYEMYASKEVLSQIKPSLILHFYEVALQEKILIKQANEENIPSLLIQHGTHFISLPEFNKLNFVTGTLPIYDNKKFAVWGNLMKEYAIKNGMKEENVIVSGSLRHNPYFKIENKTNNNGAIILALANITPLNSSMEDHRNYIRYEKSLEFICEVLSKIKNRKKIAKLHPGSMLYKTVHVEPIIKQIDPSIEIIVNADLSELIPKAAAVITLGLTTFNLDSNIFHVPAMAMAYDPQDFFSVSNCGYTKLFNYSDSIEFEKYLHSLLTDEKTREENIQKGKEWLNSYLSNQGTATKFLINKILEY